MTSLGRTESKTVAMLSGRSKSKSGRPTRSTSARAARADATCPVPPVTRIGRSDMEQRRAIAQPWQDLVLVRENDFVRCDRPRDANIRIVPDDTAFGWLIVGC